jgi:hypothetical protein
MLCWAEGRVQVVLGMSHGDDTFQKAASNNFASPGEPCGGGECGSSSGAVYVPADDCPLQWHSSP